MRKSALFTVIFLGTLILAPQFAAGADTSVTVAVGGVFPDDTTFNSVPIYGLNAGYGIEIADNGSALGQLSVTLLGVSVSGEDQNIKIEGKATRGSRTAVNVATFSGTCSVDMGDGIPAVSGIPFSATITTNAKDEGTIGLTLGATTLPEAVVNAGSMTIKTP